ncbi:hypothetical protein D9753_03880 [Streptomyces dangxiongensis]|uniref:Uncharacterized protein n=1 Tax=Streptomyces dangxiongensis TaxID=1442032 RepID=A0A3G2J7J0_9ACTN|nr:hypothetical protein D9753_03880 [Streptomyces dangxiongensis]
MTTKLHLACDGRGRPLAILLTPGQRHDSIGAGPLPERIHVPRTGPGRPRHRPDQVIADNEIQQDRHLIRGSGQSGVIPALNKIRLTTGPRLARV